MGSGGAGGNTPGSQGTTATALPTSAGTGAVAVEKASSGVQRLLDTEREANRLVLEARQCMFFCTHSFKYKC